MGSEEELDRNGMKNMTKNDRNNMESIAVILAWQKSLNFPLTVGRKLFRKYEKI